MDPILKILIAACFICVSAPLGADDGGWTYLYEEDGLKVYRQDKESLPTFKAAGRLEANLYELLAIMADVDRRVEWVGNLTEIKLLEGDTNSRVVVYSRFDLPWPAEDRDSVMEVTVDNDYVTREVKIAFRGLDYESRPPVDGVVRIPYVKGHTFIKYVDERHVDVEQVGSMDPGGSLPLWLVKMVAEDQPVNTIRALKKQMVKTRGDYDGFIRKHEEARLRAVSASKH